MIHVQSVIEREIGLRNFRHYDNVLSRLVVTWNDSYRGISPSTLGLNYNPEPPIFACRFAEKENFEHYVAIANEDGRVAIQDTFKMEQRVDHPPLEGVQCHENAVFDLAWMTGSMQFVTVSGDHTARLWDINESSIRQTQVFYGHSKSVKTVAFRPHDPSVFATGARDGKILIWDTRANIGIDLVARPDNSIFNCHPVNSVKTPVSASKRQSRLIEQPRANSITGLVFQNDDTLISCADGDGNIKIWDLRKNYSSYKKDPLPKQSIAYCGCSSKNGYTNLIFDKCRFILYANCMDNVIYSFNVTSYNVIPLQRYIGHENSTFYIKSSLSPDGYYLLSGSSDAKAYLWNVKQSHPIVQLEGHSAEVTCATWCQVGDIKIVTCGDDARHKIWRINKEYPDQNDVLDYRGSATKYPTSKKIFPALDHTPQSLKRKLEPKDTSSRKKSTTAVRGSPSLTRRSSKRSLLDMLNGTLTSIKEENSENEINNINVNSSGCDSNQPSTSKRHCPDSFIQTCYKGHDEGDKSSEVLNKEINLFTTPKKSPRKLVISSPKNNVLLSPLTGFEFPNFVLNGDAPHLGLMSPPKRVCRSVDWLTRLSLEKTSNKASNSAVSPQTSQITQRRNSHSKTPTCSDNNSSHRTPTRTKINTSLFHYFSSTKSSDENN